MTVKKRLIVLDYLDYGDRSPHYEATYRKIKIGKQAFQSC